MTIQCANLRFWANVKFSPIDMTQLTPTEVQDVSQGLASDALKTLKTLGGAEGYPIDIHIDWCQKKAAAIAEKQDCKAVRVAPGETFTNWLVRILSESQTRFQTVLRQEGENERGVYKLSQEVTSLQEAVKQGNFQVVDIVDEERELHRQTSVITVKIADMKIYKFSRYIDYNPEGDFKNETVGYRLTPDGYPDRNGHGFQFRNDTCSNLMIHQPGEETPHNFYEPTGASFEQPIAALSNLFEDLAKAVLPPRFLPPNWQEFMDLGRRSLK